MKYVSSIDRYNKLIKEFMMSLHSYLIGVLKLSETYNSKLYEDVCKKADFKSKAIEALKEWNLDNEKNAKSVENLLKKGDYSISLAKEIENTPRPKNFNIGTLHQDYLDEQEECERLIKFLNEDIESAKGSENYNLIVSQANANIERLKRLSVELGRLAEDLRRSWYGQYDWALHCA